MRATPITGMASTSRIDVMSVIHVKTGSLNMVMPGARMLKMVTTKFRPAAIEATPSTLSPMAQNVMPEPVLKVMPELGA